MGDTLKVEEDTQGQARHTHTHTQRGHTSSAKPKDTKENIHKGQRDQQNIKDRKQD